jgi:hypothetical protein
MSQSQLIPLYCQTFNMPMRRSRLVFDKMIEKYDEFFDNEKKQAERELNALVQGRQVHDIIK